MIGLGTLINVGAIIIGGLLGLFLGRNVKVRYQDILMIAVGICVLMLGIGGTMEQMLSIPDGGAEGEEQRGSYRCENKNIPDAHSSSPMPWVTKAATHAIRHCHTARPAAHLPPSSRRTEATAAMHGVYSRLNTSKDAADSGERMLPML